MDDTQLRELRNKVEKADKLKTSIANIEKILNDIQISGHCKKIEFDYWGQSEGGWGLDVGEWCSMGWPITAESLKLTDNEFDEWFTKPLKAFLKELQMKLKDDLEKLQ